MSEIKALGDALAAAVFALLSLSDPSDQSASSDSSGSSSDASGSGSPSASGSQSDLSDQSASSDSGSPVLSVAALPFHFVEKFDGRLTGKLQMAVTQAFTEGAADTRGSSQCKFHYAIHTFMAFESEPTINQQDALVVWQENIVRALPKMSCNGLKPQLEAFNPVDGEELLADVIHGLIGVVFTAAY